VILLNWPPAQLEQLRAQAWAKWLAYGASTRRQYAREWVEATSTALEVRPTVETVVPDAYYPPGAFGLYSNIFPVEL